jgi:hypothetical protein
MRNRARLDRLEQRVPPRVERCPDCGGPIGAHGERIYLPDNRRGGPAPCDRCNLIVVYTSEPAPPGDGVGGIRYAPFPPMNDAPEPGSRGQKGTRNGTMPRG